MNIFTMLLKEMKYRTLTYKLIPRLRFWNFVVNRLVMIKVERLERIKHEVAHIFVHVDTHHASIKVVNHSATIHDLFGRENLVCDG